MAAPFEPVRLAAPQGAAIQGDFDDAVFAIAAGREMTPADEMIIDALASYVRREAGQDQTIALAPDTDIIGEGLVDSVGIFKLIAFVEEKFAVTIEPQEVVLENFRTLGSLRELIAKKLQGDIAGASTLARDETGPA